MSSARHDSLRRHGHRLLLAVVAFGLLVEGCSTSNMLIRHPPLVATPALQRFGTLSSEQRALIDANCYDGLPVDTRERIGSTELVIRQGYVPEHSSLDKIPLWVCESVSLAQLQGHLTRSNRFKADPELRGSKAYPRDYAKSGFDRGHQAPAGNQTVDPLLKDQTFYLSNVAPQRPSLNRGIWKQLEDKTRSWVFRYGHAYEWTGPVRCTSRQVAVPDTRADCRRQTIGEHEVAVPLYFYKIILVQDHLAWKAIAFVVPNAEFKPPYHLDAYITSIERIEQQTGIEFMPSMSLQIRRALISEISAMWP